MAWTQSDLDAIRASIASGVQQVHYADGRRVVYQTLADMMAAEQRIAAFVNNTSGAGAPRRRFAAYRNGC